MEIALAIAFVVVFTIMVASAVLGAVTSSWPDEKREKWGLGPKGQGR